MPQETGTLEEIAREYEDGRVYADARTNIATLLALLHRVRDEALGELPDCGDACTNSPNRMIICPACLRDVRAAAYGKGREEALAEHEGANTWCTLAKEKPKEGR